MIGTLTLHYNSNYGANLQAYALVKAITQVTDEEVALVDYRSFHVNNLYAVRPFDIFPGRRIVFSVNALKRVTKMLINPAGTYLRNRRFGMFRKKNIPMTKTVMSMKQINDLRLDKVLIGSDQVWNRDITFDDEGVFWGAGISSHCKLGAYAPSLGKDNFENKEMEYAKRYLDNFDYLTVREEKLAQNIEQLFKRNAYVVCDPVLLISQNEWKALCKNVSCPKPFILIYQLGQDKKMIETAVKIAKEKDWDVVYLNDGRNVQYAEVIHNKVADPIDFLSLINAAEIVMTDSFHGAVFSVVFNKDFYVFPYFRRIRIIEFLEKVGLSERIIESGDCSENNFNLPIQTYAKVNRVLEHLRKESKEHLLKMVNG